MKLLNRIKRITFIHKIYLFFKPAYWRVRTPTQRQFDARLKWICIGCLIGILIAMVILPSPNHLVDYQTADEITSEEYPAVDEEQMPPAPTITSEVYTLEKNEALSTLLSRAGVSLAEALEASQAFNLVLDLRKIQIGQKFEIFTDSNGVFRGIKTETKKGDILSVFKDENDEFIPEAQEGKIQTLKVDISGKITSNFSEAALKKKVPSSIVRQVEQALDMEIDFSKEIKKDSDFRIIYEKKETETGRQIGNGQLLFVSLETNKKRYKRYFFKDAMGVEGFYSEKAEKSQQTIMKRPLGKAGRISSGYGTRVHPILGHKIHHDGIDFAAKMNTPIPAAADGVIVELGRKGGYGKYIRIKHNNTYSTAYAHMNDYGENLRIGSFVKRGEVIGYVGSTGRSTGPHLHYEVIKNKVQVNPSSNHVLPKRILKNNSLESFNKIVSELTPEEISTKEEKVPQPPSSPSGHQ